jgi:hypothetical protein
MPSRNATSTVSSNFASGSDFRIRIASDGGYSRMRSNDSAAVR